VRTIEKVTAFITRSHGPEAELLLFHHPLAGIQLPAGTVDMDEAPETAVLRETWEETGLQNVTIAAKLGQQRWELPSDERWVLRSTKLFDAPAFDASGVGPLLLRGTHLAHLEDAGKFARVRYTELDMEEQPPRVVYSAEGFVRRSVLGQVSIRHFYHLPTHSETPERWQQRADGHMFECFWAKLSPKPGMLVEGQQQWLDTYYDELVAAVGSD
jgi:8-oxo-dGTP pyrophosphatase MutT (NUDIX family)